MLSPADDLSPGQACLLAGAVGAVGLALQIRDGSFHPAALALVGLACALTVLALAVPRLARRAGEGSLVAVLATVVGIQLALLVRASPAMDMPPDAMWPWRALMGGSGLLLASAAVGRPRPSRWQLPVLLGLHLAAGLWLLARSGPVITDVRVFQEGAIAALFDGKNPYEIRFRNIYPNDAFYGPGLVVRGVLQFGYPYLPLPLYAAIPAFLAGDLRWAHLTALVLGAGMIGLVHPGRVGLLAAALLLTSPRVGLVMQMGWTEPFVILCLAATVLAAVRAPRLLPLPFGLLLASKQYMALAIPLAWLLLSAPRTPRALLALLGQALAVAAAVTLPLALGAVGGFIRSAVTLQFVQPFRKDALSFAAALARAGGPALSVGAFVAAAVGVTLALRKAPRSPAGFAMAVGATFLLFLAFSKQAFCNYYFVPIAALALAIAAARPRPP